MTDQNTNNRNGRNATETAPPEARAAGALMDATFKALSSSRPESRTPYRRTADGEAITYFPPATEYGEDGNDGPPAGIPEGYITRDDLAAVMMEIAALISHEPGDPAGAIERLYYVAEMLEETPQMLPATPPPPAAPAPAPTENAGTYADPIRYEEIRRDDPNRQAKLEAQRERFEADATAGKVIDLTALMCNHGL